MRITALDVYREPLPVAHVITVERQGTGAKHRKVADVPAGGAGAFETAVTHHYLVRVLADGYGTATAQVPGTEQDIEVPVPMRPSAVVGYAWPDPLPEIPGIDPDVWAGLEVDQRGDAQGGAHEVVGPQLDDVFRVDQGFPRLAGTDVGLGACVQSGDAIGLDLQDLIRSADRFLVCVRREQRAREQ